MHEENQDPETAATDPVSVCSESIHSCLWPHSPIFPQPDAPKNVTLSVSPPRGVVQGSSVAFACASDANPPVTPTAYSLYKDGQFVSAGQSHTVLGVQPSHSGLYRCQAWNNVSWRGVDLMNSTEIRLDVQCKCVEVSR